MNTENIELLKDTKFNEESFFNLEEDEIDILLWYTELCKQLIECNDLFRVYKYNLEKLAFSYKLYYNGTFEPAAQTDNDDFICINSLVSGILSSAYNLISSLELTEKIFSDFFTEKAVFKKNYISKVYEKSFSYRLCYFLRNFSQHGHLAVSHDNGNKFCFDIGRILCTKHFNFNKNTEMELVKIGEEIYEKAQRTPKISIVGTLILYNNDISKIYKDFFDFFENLHELIVMKVGDIIKDKDNVNIDGIEYFQFYDSNKTAHVIQISSDPINDFNKYKKEAKKNLEDAKQWKNELYKNSKKSFDL